MNKTKWLFLGFILSLLCLVSGIGLLFVGALGQNEAMLLTALYLIVIGSCMDAILVIVGLRIYLKARVEK